jgi:hypothetical protein
VLTLATGMKADYSGILEKHHLESFRLSRLSFALA